MPRSRFPSRVRAIARTLTALTIALLIPAACRAQGDSTKTPARPAPHQVANYRLHPASGPIQIDGLLDEAAWQDAVEISDFHEFRPGDNLPPKVRTVCKVTYDQDHLYYCARCYDPEPSKIRAHLCDRDRVYNDDFIGLAMDTFLDHRTGYEFIVTPLGVQGDLSMSNGGDEDDSWDGLWYSAAHIDSLGWTAEISIPMRTLRFRDVPINQWGIQFFRTWPRESRYQFCSNRVSRDEPCWMCQYDHLDSLEDLHVGRNLQILPYATQSFVGTRASVRSAFDSQNDTKVGGTLRYGLTPSITLDGTLHPDFAQVEADEAQISVNNQSALSFNEKRPFFLEGSGILSGLGNLYYSRNIADPKWAAKVTGRQGRFQFGILAARDQITPLIVPYGDGSFEVPTVGVPSTDLIVRGRRDLFKDSNIGFTATAREFGDGFSRLASADAQIRLTSRLRWNSYVAANSTRDIQDPLGYLTDTGVTRSGSAVFQEMVFNSRHYNGDVWYTRKSHDYRADLGIQDQNDFQGLESWQDLEFNPAARVVDYIEPSLYAEALFDGENRVKTQAIQPKLYLRLKHQWDITPTAAAKATRYLGTLYHHGAAKITVDKRLSGLLGVHLYARRASDIYYGTEHDFGPEARLVNAAVLGAGLDIQPLDNLLINVSGKTFRLKDQGNDSLRVGVNLGLLRATYQFSPRLFVRLLSQYQGYQEPWNAPDEQKLHYLSNQFLLSYKVNYATVFFLGLNGNYDNTLAEEDGSLPLNGPQFTQTARQAFAKVQYLWAY